MTWIRLEGLIYGFRCALCHEDKEKVAYANKETGELICHHCFLTTPKEAEVADAA